MKIDEIKKGNKKVGMLNLMRQKLKAPIKATARLPQKTLATTACPDGCSLRVQEKLSRVELESKVMATKKKRLRGEADHPKFVISLPPSVGRMALIPQMCTSHCFSEVPQLTK